jgi:hypothetical protein
LRRPIVALERDHARGGLEAARKIEDVAHGRRAERIDRLRIIADDGDAPTVRLQRQQDRRLEPIGVLIFVDQHVVETLADVARERRLRQHARPIEQEVVVIEDVLRLLDADVRLEQLRERAAPLRAPRISVRENLVERRLAVDDARVDGDARALRRKAGLRARESEIVTDEVEKILGVRAIENAERLVEADALRVLPQHAGSDAVERARPYGAARRSSSSAARRENVSSSMRCGSAPWAIRCAARHASVLVLPEPAPAMISSGPPAVAADPTPCSTASRC